MDASNRFINTVEGVKIPAFFSEECFQSALQFKPEPGDVFVVTYPKCGTTWMQNLVLNIMRRGRTFERPSDFYFASPFWNQLGAEDSKNMMIRPRCYKTHFPWHKVPWSDDAKYIYVARNLKDCCVSFCHHMKSVPGYQFADGTIEIFDLFIKGQVEFGDYFDHLLPWYDARHRPNVYFTTFEEMNDLKKVAKGVAAFIDENEAKYLEENPEVLERILHNCSFGETKRMVHEGLSSLNHVQDKDILSRLPKGRQHIIAYIKDLPKRKNNKINFIRRGEVGSYKQELSTTQDEILNNIILERTQNSNVMSLWEKWM